MVHSSWFSVAGHLEGERTGGRWRGVGVCVVTRVGREFDHVHPGVSARVPSALLSKSLPVVGRGYPQLFEAERAE